MLKSSTTLVTLLSAVALGACRTGSNYERPEGPGYVRASLAASTCRPIADSLRVVSFNVEFALEVEGATQVLSSRPGLRCADIVLLQEMDEEGTRRIADALGMAYAYYPAVFHYKYDRDFGNAVLTRWPILESEKVILPHVALLTRTQRIATAATLLVGADTVRVYSTHLGTPLEVGPGARRRQLETVFQNAEPYGRVVVGGDMNSGSVGEVAASAGFDWPTRDGPSTVGWGRWDHIFTRGLALPDTSASGTIGDVGEVSDHAPIWVVALRQQG